MLTRHFSTLGVAICSPLSNVRMKMHTRDADNLPFKMFVDSKHFDRLMLPTETV